MRAATTTSRRRAAKQRLELKLKKKQDDERRASRPSSTASRPRRPRRAGPEPRQGARQDAADCRPDGGPGRAVPFPAAGKPLGNPLLRLEEAAVGYAPDRPVLQGLIFTRQDDRIALLARTATASRHSPSSSPASSARFRHVASGEAHRRLFCPAPARRARSASDRLRSHAA